MSYVADSDQDDELNPVEEADEHDALALAELLFDIYQESKLGEDH